MFGFLLVKILFRCSFFQLSGQAIPDYINCMRAHCIHSVMCNCLHH